METTTDSKQARSLFPPDAPDAFEPDRPARRSLVFEALARIFRYRLEGAEHIPRRGPALLVLNHGAVPIDSALFCHTVLRETGRWPRFLGERMIFERPRLARWLMRWGIVEGNHYQARRRFEAGDLVGVFPGGAREAWRPHREARTLRWDGRSGFARLAFKSQVPIIPCACPAVDDLYYIANDAWAWGEKILGADRRLPLPLMMGLGPLPLPVKLVHYVGAPISTRPRVHESGDEAVERVRAETVAAMEALLSRG